MRTLISRNCPEFLLVVLLNSLFTVNSCADGTGRIITPYSIHEAVSVKMVQANKAKAEHAVKLILTDGAKTMTFESAWFAYAKSDSDLGKKVYSLNGKTPTGQKKSIEMSRIESISVAESDKPHNRVLLNIQIFPDITPKQLVKEQPTYTILFTKYRANTRLWVDLGSDKKGYLSLCDSKAHIKLGDLSTDAKLDFTHYSSDLIKNKSSLWWAIPSVTDDPKYPYRIVAAA